jgi:hypothetical protein
VKDYSDSADAQNRADTKLAVDISRAEQYVISYTSNLFAQYEQVPDAVKTAVILLSEQYAVRAKASSGVYKSETFDDYAYTMGDQTGIDYDALGLVALLDGYVVEKSKGTVALQLRKL